MYGISGSTDEQPCCQKVLTVPLYDIDRCTTRPHVTDRRQESQA